jgi:hypothetical protein
MFSSYYVIWVAGGQFDARHKQAQELTPMISRASHFFLAGELWQTNQTTL